MGENEFSVIKTAMRQVDYILSLRFLTDLSFYDFIYFEWEREENKMELRREIKF